jgi:hypothetical protein
MRKIAFSRLLLLVALVPLVFMALFAVVLTYESWTRHRDLAYASSVLRLAVATSRLGCALPAEGAATRVYLGGGDKAASSIWPPASARSGSSCCSRVWPTGA